MTTTIKKCDPEEQGEAELSRSVGYGVLKVGNTAYEDGLFNNPAFPNTPFPLPAFRQDLDSFSTLIVAAEDGGKKSISAKNKQRAEVIRVYTLLGHYVEATCNNDPAIFKLLLQNRSGALYLSKPRRYWIFSSSMSKTNIPLG